MNATGEMCDICLTEIMEDEENHNLYCQCSDSLDSYYEPPADEGKNSDTESKVLGN
jgi:hypothetical protein